MIYSRNYARMFVTLQQENSDYSYDFKDSMGRCVIEVRFGKGKFSVYIQGLKQGEYNVVLVSCKNMNNTGVVLGKIKSDSNGKGELRFEFDPENVCKTNLKLEDFHVVVIMPDEIKASNSILTGYVNGTVQWKENFSIFDNTDDTDKNSKIEKISNLDTSENMNKNSNLKISEKTETEQTEISLNNSIEENNDSDTVEEEIAIDVTEEKEISDTSDTIKEEIDIDITAEKDKKIEQSEQIEETDSISNEQTHLEQENIELIKNDSEKSFNDIIKKFRQGIEEIEKNENYKGKITELKEQKNIAQKSIKNRNYAIDYIFEHNLKMSPFEKQNKDVYWVRIDSSELVVFSGRLWVYLNNPFVAFSEKKYKHLILGRYVENEKENYILGVPSRFFSDYKLEANIQGFKQFKCCNDKVAVDGDYGYWLLKIQN